jgi:HAD superfamily hydrolase (TIGR01509 family)
MPGLIFDCDGVLIDTEHGHLRAFNEMWRQAGVPWSWTAAQYAAKLRISGGKERLNSLYDESAFRAAWPVPSCRKEWRQVVESWHRLKTQIFLQLVRSGQVQARPGVARIAAQSHAAGWRTAVATASAAESAQAVLNHVMGPRLAAGFAVIGGDSVEAKKPAPDVYLRAAQVIGQQSRDCVVIEDTCNGLRAATAAGMVCVVTPTQVSKDEDFDQAALVISCLGDPDGPVGTVLRGPADLAADGCLRVDDLTGLLTARDRYIAVPGGER